MEEGGIRGLIYLTELYKGYIERNGLRIYNETNKDQKPCLNVEALLININYGCNKELMNKCEKLMEYSQLIAMIRKNYDELEKKYAEMKIQKSKKEIFAEAVSLAIEEAIRNNILKETLRNNKAEVTDMLLTEFDEKDYIEGVKEESERRGELRGRVEGEMLNKIAMIIKKVKKAKPLPTIAAELEEEEEEIKPIYKVVVASAPDYNIEEIKAKLNM